MKQNMKQIAWSRHKVAGSIMKSLSKLVMCVFALFAVASFVMTIAGDVSASVPAMLSMFPIILFTMADIGDVTQPSDIETAGDQIGFRLWLVARDQIDDSATFPTPNAARELGTIPLNDGEYMHHFDAVENSLKYTGTMEKGDVTSTFGKTIPVIIRYSIATLNFIESYQGKGFVLIWADCETDAKSIVGNFAKPVVLSKSEVKTDSDGKYVSLEFSNTHWRQPLIYTGSMIEQEATIIDAGTAFAYVTGQDNYTLTAGANALATLSGVGSSDYGKYLTISAPASGVAPTIPDSGVFVLKDAETWTANPGSTITFQIFDDATLVEVDRVQTAAAV